MPLPAPPERLDAEDPRGSAPAADGASRVDGGLHIATWIVAIVALTFMLRAASDLFIPIVLAVLMSYALEPLVAWLSRHRVPRAAGAGVLLGIILSACGWATYSLQDDAVQALQALPAVAERVRAFVWTEDEANPAHQLQRAAEALQGPVDDAPSGAANASAGTGGALGATVGEWARRGVGSALTFAGNVTVVVFLVFFLLLSGGHFRARLVEIAGRHLERRRITATIIDEINAQIQRFLLVRLATAIVVAIATWAVLAWMGIGQAAVWGILAGIFNSIPYFGPIIVSGGLLLVGLVQTGDITRAVQVSAAALLITSLEGWLITPPLMGKAERMHVVVVFLGVLLWTWIWGAWGTILAVPMLVVAKAIADHIDSLKPAGRLMAP